MKISTQTKTFANLYGDEKALVKIANAEQKGLLKSIVKTDKGSYGIYEHTKR